MAELHAFDLLIKVESQGRHMKYIILAMLLSLLSPLAAAEIVQSRIDSIEKGKNGEPHLVKLTVGRVVFIEFDEVADLRALEESLKKNELLEFSLDERHNPISIQTLSDEVPGVPGPQEPSPTEGNDEEEVVSYEPSIISSSTAVTIFRRMSRRYQNDSQCYNRAHVWAYEEFNRSGFKSMKAFLFFTSRYIRNYRYHWWFHVTPMAYVGGSARSNWRALDRRYTGGPLTMRTWTNIFVKSHRECPVVYRYSDYNNHQYSEDCYVIPVSQYYWQPRDIDNHERTGHEKQQFITSEINYAYWEAF